MTLVLNAFVLDEYDAYGEVPIPGSSSLQLPAGDVTVTFHTVLIGGSGSGLPVPPLKYRITGPGGVDVQLTEDYGSTTTVNNDARVRIGYLHVPDGGHVRRRARRQRQRLPQPDAGVRARQQLRYLPWIFAAVFGFAVVDLIVARIWAARVRRAGRRNAATRRSPAIADFGAAARGPPATTWRRRPPGGYVHPVRRGHPRRTAQYACPAA